MPAGQAGARLAPPLELSRVPGLTPRRPGKGSAREFGREGYLGEGADADADPLAHYEAQVAAALPLLL